MEYNIIIIYPNNVRRETRDKNRDKKNRDKNSIYQTELIKKELQKSRYSIGNTIF